jgi:protein CpxP
MKRMIWSSIAALALAAVVAIPVIAQPPQGGGRGAGRGPGFGGPMPMLRGLNLTDAQREQIRTLAEQRRDANDNPARKVADLQRQLQAALFADAPDQQKVDELKSAIVAATTEELTARIELQSRIAQVLTPEQRAQAREALGNAAGRRGAAPGRRAGRVKI